MKQGNIENFTYLSQFKDIKDFNNQIEQWMIDVKDKFTKSELIALKRLIRFSAKIVGVCNAKIGTIVSATYENNNAGISRSTFKRMVVKAKEIGLLIVKETERMNGSQSSNVYIFNRITPLELVCEPPKSKKLDYLNKTINPIKTNNQNNNKRNSNVSESDKHIDASFVSERVPVEFTNLVKCFFNDAKQIEEYWKLVKISAFKNKVTENILETALQCFKILVRKVKFCKVTNIYGFFFGVLNRKFKATQVKGMFNCWWEIIC